MDNKIKYEVTEWINSEEIETIHTSEYWNDSKVEAQKLWSIPNNNFTAFEKYFNKKC